MAGRKASAEEGFRPHFPRELARRALVQDASNYFGLSRNDVDDMYQAYHHLHKRQRYRKLLGEKKTLCFEEAFVVYVAMTVARPATIVEVGTQYGKSTRRILDMKEALGLEAQVVCYDISDDVQFFSREEARLVIEDITGRFREAVLDPLKPGLIYLDARPYALLKDVIGAFLDYTENAVLTIHDCGRGLCNPNMALAHDDLEISSHTGVWERYALAESLGVEDPLDTRLDDLTTDEHRVKIFNTPHGLAVVARRATLNQ